MHSRSAGLLVVGLLVGACNPPDEVKDGEAGAPTVAALRRYGARAGSTAERRAAWERMDSQRREAELTRFRDMLRGLFDRAGSSAALAPSALTASDTPLHSGSLTISQETAAAATREAPGAAALRADVSDQVSALVSPGGTPHRISFPPSAGAGEPALPGPSLLLSDPAQAIDADGDGLDDGFERRLADLFEPIYHVSAGELDGTGSALFGDFAPQTVVATLPSRPPVSHVRVHPLGYVRGENTTLRVLQIDYLTLWNRDDGLPADGRCSFGLFAAGALVEDGRSILDGVTAHALDNERSAVLVAAPAARASDPTAYQAYSYFIAAHESTELDQSSYLDPSPPLKAGAHLNLWLALSKHASYNFNPEYYPLLPTWLIRLSYSTLYGLYNTGLLSPSQLLSRLYVADTLYFGCVAERFNDQGPTFAGQRIHVGEATRPLPGAGFITDTAVRGRFEQPLWLLP